MTEKITLNTVFTIKKENLSKLPADKLGTTGKAEITDLAPLIIDFVQQDKKIYLLDSGTGFGKSYSLNTFMSEAVTNKELFEKINQIYYITDRKHNVKQEYEDFKKRYPKEAKLALPIKNNLDTIVENNGAALHGLSKKFKNLKEYKSLDAARRDYKENNENLAKQLRAEETIFRKKVKDILFKEYPSFVSLPYEEKLEFIKNNPDLSGLLNLYPTMLSRGKKILFLTIDKFFLPFDTIIDRNISYIYQDESFMKNSIVLLDESDAMAGRILDKIVEQSFQNPIDIIEKIEGFYSKLKMKKLSLALGSNDIDINTSIKNALTKYEKIKDKFYLDYSIVIDNKEEMGYFISKTDDNIIYKTRDQKKQYIEFNASKGEAVVKNAEAIENNVSSDKEYSSFVLSCTSMLHEFYLIIKKIAIYYKNSSLGETEESSIRKVLDYFHIIDFSNSEDTIYKRELIRSISLIDATGHGGDFYLQPGELIRTELPDDRNLIIKLISNQLSLTPEKFLKLMMDNGSKIILSSATSRNKSTLRNFNLNWPYIRDEIFIPTKHSQELEEKYYNRLEKNKKDVNIIVNKITSDIDENKILSLVNKRKDEFSAGLKTINSACNLYYRDLYYEVIWDILDKLKNNVKASLVFLKFNLVTNTKNGALEFKDFLENIIKKEYPDFECFYANASNLDDEIEKFKSAAKDNKNCFLLTTYETAEKGLNLKIRKTMNLSDVVILNDLGEKEFNNNFNKETNSSNVEVDIDGIYLGDITYIYPSVTTIKESGVDGHISSMLTASYYAQSMNANNLEIENMELNEVLSDILNSNKQKQISSFFGEKNIKNSYQKNSYIFKIISTIIQSVGRKCRCNIKMKNNYITLNSNLCEKTKITNELLSQEKLFLKQPFEIKKVFESLISAPILTENISLCKKEMMEKKSNDALEALKNFSKLKSFYSLTSYSVSLKNYIREGMGKKFPQELYFETPPELIGKKGYDCNSDDNKHYFYICNPSNKGQREISIDALNLSDKEKEILKNNKIKLSTEGFEKENSKILTPLGFDFFAKNIGYILGKNIFQNELKSFGFSDLKELSDAFFKKMDNYTFYKDNLILIKYNFWKSLLINDDINVQDVLDIKKYFETTLNKKSNIFVLEIDIKKNTPEELLSVTCDKTKDYNYLSIKNIYDNNGLVRKQLEKEIKKYM